MARTRAALSQVEREGADVAIGGERSEWWRRAAAIATGQEGMLGGAQLRRIGFGPRDVERAVAISRLVPVHRGVHALGYIRRTVQAGWWAALLATAEEGRLSHRSGVERLGMLAPTRGTVHVTVARDRRFDRRGIDVHRPRRFDEDDVIVVEGMRVTRPALVLVEFAAVAHPRTLERAVHSALVDGQTTVPEVLDRLGRAPRPGSRALRRALAMDATDLRSRAEGAFARMCRRRVDLEQPDVNTPLAVAWGTIVPDFCWLSLRLIIEIDGPEVHGTTFAFRSDRRRDRRLEATGWNVSRFPADEVLESPDQVEAEYEDLIRAARGRRSPGSAWGNVARP